MLGAFFRLDGFGFFSKKKTKKTKQKQKKQKKQLNDLI
jgi:hypothetical protein